MSEKELTAEEREIIESLHDLAGSGNYYMLLGLPPDTDAERVRDRYYDLSRSWHPDRFYRYDLGEHKEKLESVFVAITQAYSTLTHPDQREAYDEENAELIKQMPPLEDHPLNRRVETSKESDAEGTSTDASEAALYEIRFEPRRGGTATSARAPDRTPERKLTRKELREQRRKARKPRRRPVPGIDKVRKQIQRKLARARRYHRQSEEAAAEGNWAKAASSAYLASRYQPENALYRQKFEEYDPKAREQLARQAIQAAESAESYHNAKAAIQHYEKACEADPPFGLPFYRLAELKKREDEEHHDVLRLLRTAVEKEPKKIRYRLALAELYLEEDLRANARREFQTILGMDPSNKEAKAGMKKVKG